MNKPIETNRSRKLNAGLRTATIPRHEEGRRRSPTYCCVPDCLRATQQDKPWCTKHIALSPYAKRLAEEISRFNANVDAIQKGRRPRLSDPFTQEVVTCIEAEGGTTTSGAVSRKLLVPTATVDTVFEMLANNGRAKLTQHKKSLHAELVD